MDLDVLRFLAAPFVASLILTGIHAYLGVHVVEGGVIFVDLSLAQIAALGSTMAILLPFTGQDPHAPWVYWTGLVFTTHEIRHRPVRCPAAGRNLPCAFSLVSPSTFRRTASNPLKMHVVLDLNLVLVLDLVLNVD